MYSDEGISGTSTRRRDGFNRMVEDALAGRIGLILTKSVSRFARNTVDSLTTIRKLKEHGTEVFFEKENIWTFDSKGELLLTIMSSLAQEESRSISLNVTWGQRKRFADGKATAPFSVFLGYDRGENGEFVINPEQAEIVKIIYGEFLKGFSFKAIARKLTEMGIKSPKGKDVWNESTVKSILTNEKYPDDSSFVQERRARAYFAQSVHPPDHAPWAVGLSVFLVHAKALFQPSPGFLSFPRLFPPLLPPVFHRRTEARFPQVRARPLRFLPGSRKGCAP